MAIDHVDKDEQMLDERHSDGKSARTRAAGASSSAGFVTARSAGRERISITIAIRGVALFGEEVVV